ncbi:MAG: hypothetical protein OHK0024_33300 [Thalassobaculales bacterium]
MPCVSPEQPVHCYSVLASPDPGLLSRVLEPFAKRGLTPQRFHAVAAGGEVTVDIQLGDVEAEVADLIAANLRQIVCVAAVLTSVRGGAGRLSA